MSTDKYILERLINRQQVAEGTNIPPFLRGEFRVPFVRAFQVVKTVDYLGSSLVTLVWEEPDNIRNVSHFNIYVSGALNSNSQPTFVGSAARSPANVLVMTDQSSATSVTFYCQTVLRNGLTTEVSRCPTTTGQIQAARIKEADLAFPLNSAYSYQDFNGATGINIDDTISTTILNESAAGALLAVGIEITTVPTSGPTAGFKITVDGAAEQYMVLFSAANNWLSKAATSAGDHQGNGTTIGDYLVFNLGIAYNTSITVKFVTTAVTTPTSVGRVSASAWRALKI